MAIRVGINGFGRIGRLVFRVMQQRDDFEVVAVNDLADARSLSTLLKYDSVHGRFPAEVKVEGENIVVDGRSIPVLTEKDPTKLPWREMDVYFVVESTGVFRTRAGDRGGYGDHLKAGAQKVLLTVPAKDEVDATIVMGVNDEILEAGHQCISNASCTTNCLGPITKVLHESFGVRHALMTTIHAYTNDQVTCDLIHKDLRRARAAAVNIIPTTTGAAKAIGKAIPALEGKINGMAIRVPVADGSLVDLVAECEKAVTAEAVNEAMQAAAEGSMKGVLEYCEDPIVSSDVVGNAASSILDSLSTMAIASNMVKVVSWYDNEWGYSSRVVDLMARAASL